MDFVQFFISLLYFCLLFCRRKKKVSVVRVVTACITHGTDETATANYF